MRLTRLQQRARRGVRGLAALALGLRWRTGQLAADIGRARRSPGLAVGRLALPMTQEIASA